MIKNNSNTEVANIFDMIDSLGFVVDSGDFVNGAEDIKDMVKDGIFDFDDQELAFVSAEEAKDALTEYVLDYGDEEAIKDCPVLLNAFFKKHSGKRFFLFGVEADLSIGVC